MSWLLIWILWVLLLTGFALFLGRHWLDKQDRRKGPP